MKAMLEKGQTNKARKHTENQTQDNKVKVVSDMPLMRQSDLCILAVDDRIRGVLQSESTSKGNGKTKMFDSQELGSLYKDHRGPSSEEQVECLKSKHVKSPADLEGKGKGQTKAKARANHKTHLL